MANPTQIISRPAKGTARHHYLTTYRYISDDGDSNCAADALQSPYSAMLSTANGYSGAIQAVTLPRTIATHCGDKLRGYDVSVIKLIAQNLSKARQVPKARRNHKSRLIGLAGVSDEVINHICDVIGRVRRARQKSDYSSQAYWEGGVLSKATKDINRLQAAVHDAWIEGRAIPRTSEVLSGVRAFCATRLSKLVGGGLLKII